MKRGEMKLRIELQQNMLIKNNQQFEKVGSFFGDIIHDLDAIFVLKVNKQTYLFK